MQEKTYTEEGFLGFYHVNSIEDGSFLYLDKAGCQMHQKSLEQIQKMGVVFLEECMHPDDIDRCLNLLSDFAEKNNEEDTLSYFKRIRTSKNEEHYDLYLTCVKLDLKNNAFCCVSVPINFSSELKLHVENTLNTYDYIQEHIGILKTLSIREIEIIKEVCLGHSAEKIAETLFLSSHTIEKHKKNIYKKTGFINNKELIEFALNFNILSSSDF